jgi:Mitochondrial carrier protein
MYTLLTYPLDIIKTNRILQTSLSREGAESLPKEFTALYEKGGLSKGLFRGLLIGYIAANFQGTF